MQRLGLICITFLFSTLLFGGNNLKIESLEPASMLVNARTNGSLPYKHNNTLYLVGYSNSVAAVISEAKKRGVVIDGLAGGGYFYFSIPAEKLQSVLSLPGLEKIGYLSPLSKMSDFLTGETELAEVFKNGQSLKLKVYFSKIISSSLKNALQQDGFFSEEINEDFSFFTIKGDYEVAVKLSSLPFIRYIGLETSEAVPLLSTAITMNRINKVQSPSPNGLGLTGRGINVAVIDGGYVGPHIDFEQRIYHVERAFLNQSNSNHATHVTGIICGAGNRVSYFKGMAPESRVFEWNYTDDMISKMKQGITTYNTMVSNNSYYFGEYGIFCGRSAEYVPESQDMDELSILYPSYLPVVSSGNSGNLCPNGWGTLPVGIQGSKNNLVVGRCDNDEVVDAGSSRGPTMDGRLKPELVAEGLIVSSTFPNSVYGNFTGTSMSAPQVTGAVALLQEGYKNINGTLPSAMLVKALLCNTAFDLGTPGPDFIHGFGRMNVYKAIKALQNNQFFSGTVGGGDSLEFSFVIPQNTAESKVMLCWTDPQASLPYERILINDLDVYVKDLSGNIILPQVANAINPSSIAIQQKDSLNNIEQVSILFPTAGTYTIVVKGYNIQSGAQDFFVTFQNDSIGIDITYPDGGESIMPGNNYIRWDAAGLSGKVTLEYSLDNGSSWTLITDTVTTSVGKYLWSTPVVVSSQVLIRAINGGHTGVSDDTFIIMPAVSGLDYTPCERALKLFWLKQPLANEYLIYQFNPNDTAWFQIGSTVDTFYWVSDLKPGRTYYFNVYPKNGSAISNNATSVQITMNFFQPCDKLNDAGVARIISPIGGRRFTSSTLTSTESVSCVLKNYGSNTIKNFNVSYSVNNSPPVVQFFSDSIISGFSKDFTFLSTADFSSPGNYILKVWTSNPGDSYLANDTFSYVVRHLPNNPVVLPFIENFDGLGTEYYTYKYVGFPGAEEFDLLSDSIRARARVGISDLYANSYPNGVTIDNLRGTGATNVLANFLMTLNLQNYLDSLIYLDFSYSSHNEPIGDDKVYLKGTDTNPPLEVFDLFANKLLPGFFKTVRAINLSKILLNNGQNFSQSTQVNFSINTDRNAPSYLSTGGYSFDDIRVYNAGKDISVSKKDTVVSICSGQYVLDVNISNHTAVSITNVPVFYSVNGAPPVKDTVTAIIPPFDSIAFSFTVPVVGNTDAVGKYVVFAWAEQPGDQYHDNDTSVAIDILKLETISFTPEGDDLYAEDFEENNGTWYNTGNINTWTWGTPQKYNMPNAGMGNRSWVNTLTRDYLNGEYSRLYTPCLPSPDANTSLSFLSQLEIERTFDSIYVEYSYDGITWKRLGVYGGGYNWYNASNNSNYWDNNIFPWQVSSLYTLPTDITSRPLMIRWYLMADGLTTYEGQGIDNVFYDNLVGITPINPCEVAESVSTTNLIPYYAGGNVLKDTILAEIKTFGGNASIKISSIIAANKPASTYHEHFLLNTRWFVDVLSGSPDSMLVRLFFADSMFQHLLTIDDQLPALSGLRLVKYNGIAQDTSLINNHFSEGFRVYSEGEFNIWPFKNGYFVEFVTDSPGEFWLQNGSPNDSAYNSTRFSSFTANRNDDKAVLDWQTIREIENSRFRLEYSTDGFNYQVLDSVPGGGRLESGSRDYQYIDSITSKSNIMYYRLSQVDSSDRVYYAGVDTADFTDTPVEDQLFNTSWQFNGLWLDIDKNISENVEVTIFNAAGALLDIYKTNIQKGRNYIGKSYMSGWPAGTYIVRITSGKISGSSRFVKSN